MESVDLTQTSGTSSPPRRDSMEDADSTLTRKRPRLDSGSRATRSMSADVIANGPQPGNTTAEPVEVTINVRSQPPSSEAGSSGDPPNAAPEFAPSSNDTPSPPLIVNQGDPAGVENVSAESPPVVEIELDDDTEEGMDDYMGQHVIQIDGEDESPADYFNQFPYVARYTILNAMRAITEHIQGGTILDF